MNPLVVYLIIVNIITFIAFFIDFHLCMRFPELDESAANSLIMDVFPVLGGSVGMLLAMFVITGRGYGHRMNKDNIGWWFFAICCLVVWGIVATVSLGVVKLDTSFDRLLHGWHPERLKILGIYLAAVNVITYAAFAWDKHVAANGNAYERRIPEAHLLGLSIAGGGVGGLCAMHIVRHKTRKWYFAWGLPVFICLDVLVILYAHMCGIL